MCAWLEQAFGIRTESVITLGLQALDDPALFERARRERVIVMTKDTDFVSLVRAQGPPPQIIHLTCGNTSNTELRRLLAVAMRRALELLAQGEPLVEIG